MPGDSSEERLRRVQRALRDSILRDYPNPQRRGCPGPDVLRQLASRDRSEDDPAWEHVTHCSPCYGEFIELLAARSSAARRCLKWLVPAAASVLIVALAAVFFLRRNPGPIQTREPVTAAVFVPARLDMRDWSPTRGLENEKSAPTPQLLPRKRLDLSVVLPIGSMAGIYELQLLNPAGTVAFRAEAHADIDDGLTIMHVRADFSKLPAGDYQALERWIPEDMSPGGWIHGPARLE
jgi:hypothetical protein